MQTPCHMGDHWTGQWQPGRAGHVQQPVGCVACCCCSVEAPACKCFMPPLAGWSLRGTGQDRAAQLPETIRHGRGGAQHQEHALLPKRMLLNPKAQVRHSRASQNV